ncbi:predicted protein [Histoplasma capsulatum G186AR]|uniref:Uncharacterized protein n=1 Tax=Ajellomyces capsulatus (strain G186AR / H82 / ATCC MYA-2454 / RMSCC 2432) TaxID=447093 RepID=C0NLX9_AJECG|nr:uncharacterized protein HCBG_04509 [Histoplasma capsulatum G186AR]EEH07630.1 predicted protein [Histoplasma capsulatum G186AR]
MAETQLRGRDLAGTSIEPRICTACKVPRKSIPSGPSYHLTQEKSPGPIRAKKFTRMQVHLPSIEQSLVHLSRLGILSTRPIHERNGEGRYYYLAQHGSFLGGKNTLPFSTSSPRIDLRCRGAEAPLHGHGRVCRQSKSEPPGVNKILYISPVIVVVVPCPGPC